jgi:ABC-type branched-subunit amino acid transport system substrate-binding protein
MSLATIRAKGYISPKSPTGGLGEQSMLRAGIRSWTSRAWSHQAVWLVAAVISVLLAATPVRAQTAKIAVAFSLTGANESIGGPALDGVRLAVEEANATGASPAFELAIHDDKSNIDEGKQLAREIGASDALVTLGPATTLMALQTGQIYSDAGIVAIGATVTGDDTTKAPTFFRAIFSTSDQGEMLAGYLRFTLGGDRAIVFVHDDGHGRAIADGFRKAAERLGIAADYRLFRTVAESEDAARDAASDPANPAIILATYDKEAAPVVTVLRRQGARGPILGTLDIADEHFPTLFADQPEERQKPGFFTNGIFAASPVIFDSGNAETLAFADRFRARFGREPTLWSAQSYEGVRLAIAAVRATATSTASGTGADLRARRDAIRGWLLSLNSAARGIRGLNGPVWFTPDRGREQALRIGRFQNGIFVTAPGQLVPVRRAEPAEISSGVVVEISPGRLMRRQQVVYTGIFLNEISRVDIAQSTFTADFYLWMRFGGGSGVAGADPSDIRFPTLVRGGFDPARPSAQGNLDDGTTYRLWQITGDFKNDFDLRHYPADRQTLVMRFFNSRAASDRIVYVQDRRSSGTASWVAPGTAPGLTLAATAGGGALAATASPVGTGPSPIDAFNSPVASVAFRNLTQWEPIRADEGRDNLVTQSALGDPRLVGQERVRELSGFDFTVDLRRRVLATLAKNLFPLGLMALIMFASLYFPPALVKEKVTVAITGALSGAVLLASINSQLGSVGYVIAIEYVFYAFFALCLLCIVAVLAAERLRAAKRPHSAVAIERSGRYMFAAGVGIIIAAAWLAYAQW